MLKFGNLISPNIALTLLKTNIEKQVNFKVGKYKVIYHINRDTLGFKIYRKDDLTTGINAVYDHEVLNNTIKNLIEKKVGKNHNMEMYIIDWEPNKTELTIYTKDKHGKKQVDCYEI